MAKITLFGGDWRKVLIKVVLLLLVLWLVYNGIQQLIKLSKKAQTREEKQDIIDDIVVGSGTTDNTTTGDPDTITDSEAMDIANKLETAMTGWGTDEDQMFNLLQCLNGASLQKVKVEFGVRDYDGDATKPYDLFDWFATELDNNTFSSVYWSECVEGCEDWSSAYFSTSCFETPYMRKIWEKSGLLITF